MKTFFQKFPYNFVKIPTKSSKNFHKNLKKFENFKKSLNFWNFFKILQKKCLKISKILQKCSNFFTNFVKFSKKKFFGHIWL